MRWMLLLFGVAAMGQPISLEKERALGRGLAQELRRLAGPAENEVLAAFVQRVGKRLAGGAEFEFELVGEGRMAEPVGVPGGLVLVPTSLFRLAEDEAEFAGVLAHAMAHVALRHGWMNPPTAGIPLFFLGTHEMVPMGYLDAARQHELEADRYAARLAARAGYDAAALRNYIRRVQPETAWRFAPLPPRAERLAALELVTAPGGEVGGSEYLRLREMAGMRVRKAPSLRR